VYRLLHAGTLPGRRFGKNLRVPRDAVAAYIHNSRTGGT
jgi:excisionase family DNA binding protein